MNKVVKEVKKPRENRLKGKSDVLSITDAKFDLFLMSINKYGQSSLDALTLYLFYQKMVKMQGTYQIWACNSFVKGRENEEGLHNGLNWSKKRVASAKKVLYDFNLITDVKRTRDSKGHLDKQYILINCNISLESHPEGGYRLDGQRLDGCPIGGLGDANALTKQEMLLQDKKFCNEKESAFTMNEMQCEKPITSQTISPKGLSSREEDKNTSSYYIYKENTNLPSNIINSNLPSYTNSNNVFFNNFLSQYDTSSEVEFHEDTRDDLDFIVSKYPQFSYDGTLDEHMCASYLKVVDIAVQDLNTKEHNSKMLNMTYEKLLKGNDHFFSKHNLDQLLNILNFDSTDARSWNCINKYGAIQNMFNELSGISNPNDVLGRIVYVAIKTNTRKSLNYIFKAFKAEVEFEDHERWEKKTDEEFARNKEAMLAQTTPDVCQTV